MELRSSRVLNHDSGNKKRPQLSSDKSNSGKNGANEVEIGVCVDNADDNLETGSVNARKIVSFDGMKNGGNTDDKGLFSGSEVFDPVKDLVVSCPEGEIEEESIERVKAETSGGGGEEGNKSVIINSSERDGGFKDEIAPQHISSTDCENGTENVESVKLSDDITIAANGDNNTETMDGSNLLDDSENADVCTDKNGRKKGKGQRGRKKRNAGSLKKNVSNRESNTRSNDMELEKGDAGPGENGVKRKRGRKRKNVEGSEGIAKKEKVEVSARVLRSRDTIIDGSVEAVDGGVEVVIGLKRMTKEDGITELSVRPKKKLKRRGRPPKVKPIENPSPNAFKMEDENRQPSSRPKNKKLKRRGRGRPPKVQSEITTKKDGILTEVPKKKLKRCGRPPKISYETTTSAEIPPAPKRPRGRPRKETVPQGVHKNRHKDTIFKKLKRHGKPPKMDSRALANVIKMRTVKLMKVKKNTNRLKGNDFKRVPKIQKIRKENGLLEVSSENPQNIQLFEGNNEQKLAKGKGVIDKPMKRLECKQVVRDKIVDILLKAGWIIDRRPRQERAYKDCVYIEPSGRSHWSITRAYLMLKKKIEDGDADGNEVSAYTPISEEEISMLFRVVDKVHGYKKKKNRKPNDVNTTGNVTKRKKSGKNPKDGSKRKRIRNSVAKLANKSLKNPNRKKGIVSESRKPRLLARSSKTASKQENDGSLAYSGKRNLLSWMIDLRVISAGSKVQYGKTRRQKRSSEGVITNDGIHCGCCDEIMGVSRFVTHAGGKLNQPFDNVYLESGTSLLKCMMDSWRKEEELNSIRFNRLDVKGDDPNDDTCNICGDGGNLICCDGCPSTFHQNCLDIQNFPSGDWNCIYCSCKFCGVVSDNAPQMDDSCDALTSEMLSCGLCEEKFHRSCLQETEAVNEDSGMLPFCGRKCQELFERLQKYLGVKLELEDGFSWTLLQRSDVGQDFTVHDTQLKVECNSKLAVAFSVMDECFVPITDERSGTSIIRNVVYNCGSNFKRLHYAGFLTAILEKGDELITAASIRIHGYRLAEMPFIGTRHMYRRQGMCRRLLDAIESSLSSIGVEELIIPAIPELLQTWTKVFGFMPLEESKRQAMKSMNMLVFPGVNMLQKPLLQNPVADRSPIPSSASDDKAVERTASKPRDNHSNESEVVKDETEEATVLMDVCSYPDPNNKTVTESVPTTSNAIDCNQRPADATEVGKDDIGNERTEELAVLTDGCRHHEAAAAGIREDFFDCEPPEETNGGCSCHKNDVSHLEKDKIMVSDGINGLCDLNFPVKNDRCRVPETTGPISSHGKSMDVRTSDDSVTAVTELHGSPKLESDVENDGISGPEASSTSKLANTFDLNLHPTTVDPDTNIVGDGSLGNEPCRKSFELLETRARVEHGDSNPCDTQPLVML